MKRFHALVVAAALCFPSFGAMAWWQSIQQVAISGGGGGRTCTDDTASTNFLARTSGLNNTDKDVACNLIKSLEAHSLITGNLSGASGCGTRLEALWFFPSGSQANGNLNICGTSFTVSVGATTCTFTPHQGYQCDGVSGWLDTNWSPATAVNATNISVSLGVQILNNRTTGSGAVPIGMQQGGAAYYYMQPLFSGTPLKFFWESGTQQFPNFTNTSTKGAWAWSRVGNNANAFLYQNNSTTPLSTATVNVVAAFTSTNHMVIGAFNDNLTIDNFSSEQIVAAWIGSDLSATEVVNLQSDLNTAAANYSVNVF